MTTLPSKHSRTRRGGGLALLLLLLAALVASPARAQDVVALATRPALINATTAAGDELERKPIGGSSGTTAASATTTASTPAPQPRSIGVDLGRMAVALGIVLALIFGARWLVTHFFVAGRAPATSRAIKVLGRTSLAPRQQILLLQVGRRVIVVGESNGQLSTLSQLEDPDEVATLVGQLQEEQIQRAASFGGLFSRVQKKFSGEEDEHAPRELSELEGTPGQPADEPSVEPATDPQARSELAGLLDKVRSIRNQLNR